MVVLIYIYHRLYLYLIAKYIININLLFVNKEIYTSVPSEAIFHLKKRTKELFVEYDVIGDLHSR